MRDPCPFLAPTRWFTPKAIRVTVQLKLRAAVGGKTKKKNGIVHTVDMPLHANHNRNAMGKRAAVFGHEIGDWRLGDWGSAAATTAVGNATMRWHCCLLYEPHASAGSASAFALSAPFSHSLCLSAHTRWINAGSCVTLGRER